MILKHDLTVTRGRVVAAQEVFDPLTGKNRVIVTPMSLPVSEFIGVYDADSTLLGEISYWVGARLGRAHCSLCDITHGIFTMKDEWKQCSRDLSVPISMYHRNDAPVDVLEIAQGSFPIVLARHGGDLRVLMTDTELSGYNGSTALFAQRLTDYLSEQN